MRSPDFSLVAAHCYHVLPAFDCSRCKERKALKNIKSTILGCGGITVNFLTPIPCQDRISTLEATNNSGIRLARFDFIGLHLMHGRFLKSGLELAFDHVPSWWRVDKEILPGAVLTFHLTWDRLLDCEFTLVMASCQLSVSCA